VHPFVLDFDPRDPERTIEAGLTLLRSKRLLQKGNTVVIVSSMLSGQTTVDAVQMRVLE
jgi:hypothetical protein